ncbi:MAG TPA: cyanophycin synthetase [Candidatus Limnocylindrales bacterium]|jgi:UDP-N-acetylmuramate--alanine ligase|nr:cyanophycin synthetase [Candidatus Limnocylindrales bacterium]
MTDTRGPGAGLAPSRAARRIETDERIHVVGIAGAGASAAGLHAAWAGAEVDGCDPGGPSPYTGATEAAAIRVSWEHDPAHVRRSPPPDRLAVTKALTAIAPHHPELEAARSAGIAIEPWQQVIADAAVGRTLVGVAGTHGKSTSAGWLVHVLAAAGVDPAAFVGALLPAELTGGTPATARRGQGGLFVVEADEYAGNFDAYRPALAVVTSAEWDHPDVFVDRAAVLAAFEAWIRRMADAAGPPVLVANVGDEGVAELAARLHDWPGRIVAAAIVDAPAARLGSYARGIADQYETGAGPATAILARIAELDAAGTSVEIHGLDPLRGLLPVRLPTAGRHNVANALGVAAAADAAGLPPDRIAAGLASFPGVGRRLERKGEAAGVVVFDDYGHHPTAIRETLAAVRQRAPGRRIWAVYEPLTFHRTAALLDEFAAVLAAADGVAIADIWPGRDPDTTITSAAHLAEAVARRNPRLDVAAPGSVEDTARWLADTVRSGDAVLVMGGGRSYRIGELLLEALAAR